MNVPLSPLKYAVLCPKETQQHHTGFSNEGFSNEGFSNEAHVHSSSVNNQRLVTFATVEKYLLTLQLIISHIKLVGLKFPKMKMLSNFQHRSFFFSVAEICFLRAILLL